MCTTTCPLCCKPRKTRAFKPLYGRPVCRKCYYAFANRRQIAFLLDWFLWYFASYVVGIAVTVMLLVIHAPDAVVTGFLFIGAYVGAPAIFFCKDGFRGYSPGKMLCGVQVLDRVTHQPIGFVASFKRNLILYVPLMPLVVAFLLLKGHRLGDGWARAKVVWAKYADHRVFTGGDACINCEYDLTANTTGVCPECGTPATPVHRAAA